MRVLYLLLVTAFFSIEANAVPRNCHWIEYLGGYDYDLGNCAGNPQLTKSVDHHVLWYTFYQSSYISNEFRHFFAATHGGLCLSVRRGAASLGRLESSGKAEPFRTSSGKAATLPASLTTR